MVITEISPQKKKGRYNIYIDGEFFSGIDELALLQAGFKVGKEVTKSELEEKVVETSVRSAFDKIMDLLLYPQSRRDIFNKLYKKGYSKDVIERAIKKAEEYGYINDSEYAASLVESKRQKSKLELKSELIKKGVSAGIINEALENVSWQDEKERAIEVAQKYMKNKEVSAKTLASLNGYLLRKGFGYDITGEVLKKYKVEDFGYGGD